MGDDDWQKGNVIVRADELEMGTKIAEGKYGTVFKGKLRGQTVAIKLLHNQHLSKEKVEELRTEVEIMTRLRHPCILLLMGLCTEKDHIALVMEYVEGRSLDRILLDQKVSLTIQKQLHLAKDIAKGINWLHCLDPPIIHRDIKPPNILVKSNFEVKVCDFGLSCVKEIPKPDEELRDTAVGSPIWMAPEVLSGHLASEKSDVYAFAIVLWEIITRKPPFSNVRSFEEFLDDVIDNHKRPPLPDDIDPTLKGLIQSCWAGDPKRRPSFAEILDRLDEALINISIKDEKGQDMWKAMKDKDLMGEHYPFFVAWPYFTEQLCRYVGISKNQEPLVLQHKGYQCLQIILAEEYKDLTRADGNGIVTVENFGKFLDTFGPLVARSDVTLFNQLQDLCAQDWFHGAITSEDAERRLKTGGSADPDKKKGYYLVRLSSNPQSCFTISRFNKEGVIVHQRITRDKATGEYLIQIDKKEVKRYDTLQELIADVSKALYLKVPCQESRDFGPVFARSFEAAGYLDTTNENISAIIQSIKKDDDKKKKTKKESSVKKDGSDKKKKKKKSSDKESSKDKKEKKPSSSKKKPVKKSK